MMNRGVLLDKEALASHIASEEFADGTVYIDVAYLREEKNQTQLEDKMLRIMVLSCTLGAGAEDKKRVQSSGGQVGANKRMKYSSQSTYNRFFLVADLESPPNCAAIMPRTIKDSARLLSVLTGGPFVGEPFMVYEPSLVTSTLGDHTPILMLQNSPLLPLKVPADQLRSTEASMTIPSNVGETNYFVLTGKKIVISAVKLHPEQSCLGIQCDRQKVAQKGGCTCLHATSHSALVYVCNVTFDVPKKVDSNGQVTVLEFCSLKTTKLFYRNFDEYVSRHSTSDLKDSNQAYRRKWRDITGYINGHGGWTLVGWFMLGDQAWRCCKSARESAELSNYITSFVSAANKCGCASGRSIQRALH
jgi:hypothetical protein